MNFTEAADTAIERLGRSTETSDDVVLVAVELMVAAWPVLAETRRTEPWDLFGLDVAAAAETLHVAVGPQPGIVWPEREFGGVSQAVVRLLRALIDHLTRGDLGADLPFPAQLEREAAAVQLARALAAVT